MHIGGSARFHALQLLWANISCVLVNNMPRMISCGLTKVELLLLKLWLFLMKLLKRSTSSFFFAIFWFLKLSQLLTNFESIKQLFDILKVSNT